MVEVRILETGEALDVIGDVNYTKMVADIGDIEKVNTSRSWTLKFPKTPNNGRIMQGIGLVGALSDAPYRTIKVAILDNGFTVVSNGNLQITETTKNEYKGNIKDGVIDFYNAISDKALGDLNLTAINHDNTRQAIIDSWTTNLPYKYLVANYNGQFLADVGGVSNFSNTSLVPSVNVKWLFDKVFSEHGWTYEGLPDINETWLSYPLNDNYDISQGLKIGEFTPIDFYVSVFGEKIETVEWVSPTPSTIDPTYISEASPTITIESSGAYGVFFPDSDFYNDRDNLLVAYRVYVNGFPRVTINRNDNDYINVGNLNVGDIVQFRVLFLASTKRRKGMFTWLGNINFYRRDASLINFTEAFQIYKIKDFVKEIMMQEAVIQIADSEKKHTKFLSVSERVNAPVIDWSKWFVEKESEKYIVGNYAQNNYFKLKYDLEGSDYNDGNLKVENENLTVSNTIFESKAYSPERERMEINTFEPGSSGGINPFFIPTLKNFEIEVKNDGNVMTLNYKTLSNRFFFNRVRFQPSLFININDDLAHEANGFPLAVPVVWNEVLADKYNEIGAIINTAKLVTVKVGVPSLVMTNLDLSKRYYFAQLNSFFIINKLVWSSGKVSSVELIKVDNG